MGLIEQKQKFYYQGRDFGDYQFTSLDDIINSFMVIHVGEDKIISKVKRNDVAFHAQRGMQELSFDTFKSCKTQEIVLPGSLQMILPQDYVNYVKLTWSDSSGIEHLMYPASKTSNPNYIRQNENKAYSFTPGIEYAFNTDFSDGDDGLDEWIVSDVQKTLSNRPSSPISNRQFEDTISASSGELKFSHHTNAGWGLYGSYVYMVYQELDVEGVTLLNLSAKGTSAAAVDNSSGSEVHEGGIIRIGITSQQPDNTKNQGISSSGSYNASYNDGTFLDLGSLTFDDGLGTSSTKLLEDEDAINVSGLNTVYLVIVSHVPFKIAPDNDTGHINIIDDVSIITDASVGMLQSSSSGNSRTWDNYKSSTPSENNNDDYIDNNYWPNQGERYGLDPQRSQVNGSFFIDCLRGKIHFSSNISGKTVILEYISDGIGTDKEMQVHKFAEEAMYKWITHAILASKRNTPEYLVARYKKERFAEIRKAKLRLSNIKLEEITQVLRGKSKQIKH